MTKPARKPTLNVVPLMDPNAADIAAQFRRMADDLDSGQIEHITSMVSVAEMDGEVTIFGWGNIDGLRAIGMLQLGNQKLTRMTLNAMEDE